MYAEDSLKETVLYKAKTYPVQAMDSAFIQSAAILVSHEYQTFLLKVIIVFSF